MQRLEKYSVTGALFALLERVLRTVKNALPSCYNRTAYLTEYVSREFEVMVSHRTSIDCPHWKPGGNANVRPHGDGANGQRFEWADCDWCRWKDNA